MHTHYLLLITSVNTTSTRDAKRSLVERLFISLNFI